MSKLDELIEELRTLPPDDLDRVENFVHRLTETRPRELHPAFAATFGCIQGKDAEDWLKAMEECETINDEPPPRFY
ncbi:MAG: hypothetical protein SGI92_22595 [Bryobacteraceae bacterium]|nr:hypothetical protein [Bryobacteraceae bacterium]